MNQVVAAAYGEQVYDLAIGFEPLDALRGGRVATPLRFEVEGFLPRPELPAGESYRWVAGPGRRRPVIDRHDSCLYALLYQPQLAPGLLDLRIYDHRRQVVPRRFRLPVLSLAMAETQAGANRVRRPLLFPGAASDLSARATGIRARVLRGAEPLRWTRVEARLEGSGTLVGRAHGDDRGEFLLVLEPLAAPPAELEDPLEVRVTVFAPAAAPVPLPPTLAADDFLWDLPLEEVPAPGDPDPVSAGETLPPGYVAGATRLVPFRLGRLISVPDFVFA